MYAMPRKFWLILHSPHRPSDDLDTSLSGVPPSMLGMRRDSTGSQSSARPEGTSPDRSSRNGDTGRLSVVGLKTPKVECNLHVPDSTAWLRRLALPASTQMDTSC